MAALKILSKAPCKRGHLGYRLVSSGACCECSRLSNKARYEENREAIIAQVNAYRQSNPEKVKASRDKYENANASLIRQRDKVRNQGERKANALRKLQEWTKQNPERKYELAQLFRRTGMQVEVDHAIPLQGRRVSGLHVAENLQLVHSLENKSKSNRFAIL
jgi:hypothetical protein